MSLDSPDRPEKLERDPLAAQQLIFPGPYVQNDLRPMDMKNIGSLPREVLVPVFDLNAGGAQALDQNINVAVIVLDPLSRKHDDALYPPVLGHTLSFGDLMN